MSIVAAEFATTGCTANAVVIEATVSAGWSLWRQELAADMSKKRVGGCHDITLLYAHVIQGIGIKGTLFQRTKNLSAIEIWKGCILDQLFLLGTRCTEEDTI